ncbi:MAG: hypothetical protein R3C99_03350 [Pirellulaceae bacterium]
MIVDDHAPDEWFAMIDQHDAATISIGRLPRFHFIRQDGGHWHSSPENHESIQNGVAVIALG